ncbi:MAG: hypothetical protein ACRYF5_04715 [Janthinobacterium lividum]
MQFIKTAVEHVPHSPSLVEAMSTLLQSPNLLVIVPIFFWFVLNTNLFYLFGLFEKRTKGRLDLLDSYLSKQEIADVDTLEILRDYRDAQYFRFATGVNAKMPMRQALVKLHRRTADVVSWTMIRRALPYIEVTEQGMAYVRPFTLLEKTSYWYNQVIVYFCLLGAFGFFGFYFIHGGLTFESFLLSTLNTFAVILFALFVFIQNFPMRAAMLILLAEEAIEETDYSY